MISKFEYIQLAGYVYDAANRNKNRVPLPKDWTEINWKDDEEINWTSPLKGDWSDDFSAGVFKKGNEVVISFTGTNNIPIDMAYANIPMAAGGYSAQLYSALNYVEKYLQDPRLAGCNISFTGHSLGGGLASLMAVFYNKPATTFDMAPFKKSAINYFFLPQGLVSTVGVWSLANTTVSPEFYEYLNSISSRIVDARQANIQHYYLDQEFLKYLRMDPALSFSIYQNEQKVLIGDSLLGITQPLDLHSLALLNLAMLSNSFRDVLAEQQYAVSIFMDSALYGYDTRFEEERQNFLVKILKDAQSISSANLLESLAADLSEIGVGGMAGFDKEWSSVNKGVIAALTEYYEFLPEGEAAKDFLRKAQKGGIELDLSLIDDKSNKKGREWLSNAISQRISVLDENKYSIYGKTAEDVIDKFQRIVLQSGSDALYADLEDDNKNDLVYGTTSKNDTVLAGGGDDFVAGLSGHDSLMGGEGNDTLVGGMGNDTLDGGADNDLLISGSGNDSVDGGEGNDILDGGADNDYLEGSSGDDKLLGQKGNDTLHGGDDNDTLWGGTDNDEIYGDDDDDQLIGNQGNDTLNGGEGEDTLWGEEGHDTLFGGDDNDTLLGGAGNDSLNGGDGDDKITGDANNDNLEGGDGNDTLWGGAGNDTLNGGAEDDVLYGGARDDSLVTNGEGKDTLIGGTGNDIYRVETQGVIFDYDGQGKVFYNGNILIGAVRDLKRQDGYYADQFGNRYGWTHDGAAYSDKGELLYTPALFVFKEGTLSINETLQIKNWRNGQLGIRISIPQNGDTNSLPKGPFDPTPTIIKSPLVLDLNADGINTSEFDASTRVYFDHEGDGFAELTGWLSKDDGLLVRDINSDGNISSGAELFGNQTRLSTGKKAANAFEALKEFDNNNDGQIDANDSIFTQLNVWKDNNTSGKVDSGELLTLTQANVKSISLSYTENPLYINKPWGDEWGVYTTGNENRQLGTYTATDDTQHEAVDVWFKTKPSETIPLEKVIVPNDIAQMPDYRGSGKVRSLHEAMALDSSGKLKALITVFKLAA